MQMQELGLMQAPGEEGTLNTDPMQVQSLIQAPVGRGQGMSYKRGRNDR